MWELFERRLAKEGLYGAEFRALDIIARFVSLPAASDPEFQGILASLPPFDFRVLCGRLSDLSEGQAGRDTEGRQGRSHWRRRLTELQRAANAVMTQRKAGEYDLTPADLPAIQACESIDALMKEILERAVLGGASAADVSALDLAVHGYTLIISDASLSVGGKRTVGFKIARTEDALGRASESLGDFTAAETHFDAARQAYAGIGDERSAAECADKRDAAAQRRLPDADRTLQQLQEALAAMAGPSLARVQALVGLAKLAHGNGDDFEAGHRLAQATEQLSALGFGVPGNGGVDYAFETWIGAIPPGRSAAFNDFLWWIRTVLSLHLDVATLRFLLSDGAKDADADVIRLAEITEKLPGHIKAVQARLQARIASTAGVAVEASPEVPAAATPEPPGQELVAISSSVNALLSKTANSPDEAKVLEQEADALVQRARLLGDRYTLALALNAAATIRTYTDVAAALPLFEQAYAQAVDVAGKQAADLAIQAASQLAMGQAGLGDLAKSSYWAGQAIDLIERDRYRVNAPFQQAAYLAPHVPVFTAGVFSAFRLGDYDTMLQRMELSKARASIRQLFPAIAASAGNPPDGPGADAASLEQELRELSAAIHRPAPAAEVDDLRARRLQVWDLRAMARRDPHAVTPQVTVTGIQALLGPDEAIVYYYWLMRAALLIVTITSDAIAVDWKKFSAQDSGTLETFIDQLSSMTSSNLSLDEKFIAPLAPLLTPAEGLPLLEGKDRLVLSPHRLLHWYPFAAMPYQGRPLVQQFALRQAPNLTSLLVPPAGPAAERVADIAVSAFPGREALLGSLPQVRQVALEIAAIYDKAGVPAKLMLEPGRAELLGALADGTLAGSWCLHLGTHGHSVADGISENAPLESMLDLADDSVDGYEIAASDLRCEIVVLTACDSGQLAIRGRGMAEQPGDELFGLPAAFLQARCGSILAPVWPADGDRISSIVVAFHRYLAQGAPADIALARAQREYLDGAAGWMRRAYWWAPLVLTAVSRPVPRAGAGPEPLAAPGSSAAVPT
jgi:CHAT domain-containing protein